MPSTRENVEPNGTIKGTIEMVDGFHKVTFAHEGCDYVLGLFSTVDEAHRVCDVLNIKEAVDARQDLQALRLHFDLGRYGVDNDTAGEIRSVSFRQVVRDLQVCAVHPINGAIGPEETQASSWAYAGATGMLTSGTRFTDAVEHLPGEEPEEGHLPHGAASAAGPWACAGAAHPRRRRGRLQPGRSAAVSPAPSAARAAFTAAGIANAAAAVEHPPPPVSPATARPLHPPPKFGDAPAQQGEQARHTQQAQHGQHDEQVDGGQVTEERHQEREQQEPGEGAEGQQPASGPEALGGRNVGASPASPCSAHKRVRGAEEEAARQDEGGRRSRGSGGSGSPPVSAGAADDSDGLLEGLAAAGAALAGKEPRQQQQQQQQGQGQGEEEQGGQPGAGEAAAPARGARGKPGRSPDTGAKRARRDSSAGRPWQEHDVLAFTLANHPFHGMTRLPDGYVAAQISLKRPDGTLMGGDSESKSKVARFAKCTTPAEAAAAWDVGSLWRAMQLGRDPASLDAQAEPAQRLNFDYCRYADMLPQLRRLATRVELQAFIKSLRNDGTLVLLATNGQQRRAASPQAAAAAAPPVPGGASRSPSVTRAPAGPSVRSLSGYHGVHGSGPWAAQLKVAVDKVVPDQQAAWTSRHSERILRVTRCASAELAAACHDLLLLWRCTLYGEDPSGPAGATLNFPLAALAAFQPALPSLNTDTVVDHIVGLRDSGALQPVLAGGRRASPPAAPAAGAASPAAATAAKPAAKRRPASAPAARQAGAKRAAVGQASSPARSPPAPPPAAAQAAEPAAAEAAAAAADAAAPAAAQAAAAGAQAAAAEAEAPAAAAQAAEAAAGARAAGAAPEAEAAGPAAGNALPGAAAAREAGQQQGQLDEALGERERYEEMYSPDELPRVEAAEAVYAEVQARLSAVPQLSQLEVVAYMTQFMRLRDMRRLMHQQVKSWSEAGEQALIVQHVHALLGRL